MKKFTQITIGLMILVGGALSAAAQSSNDKVVAEITKLEADYTEASKKLNADDLERMETVDFIMTARIPAQAITKSVRNTRLKSPDPRRDIIESLSDDDVVVRVYNENTAISTGRWKRVSRDASGKDTSLSGRFTHVWIKQNGKWLLAAAHYSPEIDLEKLRSNQTQAGKNE